MQDEIKVEQTSESQKTKKSKDTDGSLEQLEKQKSALEHKVLELDKRLGRLEKRTKNNENFGRTMSACLATQVPATEAVTRIVRKAIISDAEIQRDLSEAIRHYDKRKVRRWFSGFLGVLLWGSSVAAAALVGAAIHWLFSGV